MPDLWERIDALAVALGVARDLLWSTLVYQQRLTGISLSVVGLVAAGLSMWGLCALIDVRASCKGVDTKFWLAVLAVCAVVLTLLMVTMVMSGVWHVVNPEYYAFRWLVEAIK